MVLRKDGDRKTFTSTLRKDLYERLQSESEQTGIPISKMLDKSVERLFENTFSIKNNDLYTFLIVWFGTKGKDIDKEIELILQQYADEKIKSIQYDQNKKEPSE